jgi:hypothetical protein
MLLAIFMMGVVGTLSQNWYDPRLTWNPADFDGCNHINVPSTTIYVPDIKITNRSVDYYAKMIKIRIHISVSWSTKM